MYPTLITSTSRKRLSPKARIVSQRMVPERRTIDTTIDFESEFDFYMRRDDGFHFVGLIERGGLGASKMGSREYHLLGVGGLVVGRHVGCFEDVCKDDVDRFMK